MSLRETALLTAILLTAVPVAAAYVRHRRGVSWVVTVLTAGCMSLLLAVVWRLVSLRGDPQGPFWALGLFALAVPLLLTGFLFTGSVGRRDPAAALRQMSRPFLLLLGLGVLALVFLFDPRLLAGYRWHAGTGLLVLGPLGRAYLCYLLVGSVLVGRNLERAYRLAAGEAQTRVRPVVLGLVGVLGFLVYILTTGLVYGEVDLDNLVALALPLAVADVLTAFGFVRGSLVDTAAPVSRSVVYSSFTTLVAVLYFLAMGVAAELATFLGWSPGTVVTASFVFLVLLVAAVFLFSDRFQAAVRRFIDRHFYVNRVDYRRHWTRSAEGLDPSAGLDRLLDVSHRLITGALEVPAASISLRDPVAGTLRVHRGQGEDAGGSLALTGALCRNLRSEGRAVLVGDGAGGEAASPEERTWFTTSACQAVAPLLCGGELLGVIGVDRRGSKHRLTYEDLELLEYTSHQIAAVLRGAEWGRELSEAREMELLSNWSSMLLHDFKNYLSPLRMLLRNMRDHLGNPEFQREAVEDLGTVTAKMEDLVQRLSHLRGGGGLAGNVVDLSQVVRETLAALQVEKRPGLETATRLEDEAQVAGDTGMLRRVVENLITNALEAMTGEGRLEVSVERKPRGPDGDRIRLEVRDTGPGMSEAFVRDRLFRPFATTKKRGLGLGLYQVRSIVKAHKGDIHVDSKPGRGAAFRIELPAIAEGAIRTEAPNRAALAAAAREA